MNCNNDISISSCNIIGNIPLGINNRGGSLNV